MSFQSSRSFPHSLKIILCLLIVFALTVVPFAAMPVAHAAGGINLSTPFPGITVKAGDTVDFSVIVKNSSEEPKNVGLSILAQPEGWSGYFEGGGNQVSRVYVNNADMATVTYNAKMPADVAEGSYKIRLNADAGAGAADTLDLEINVTKTEIAKGKLTAQFPELQGSNTASFKFSMDLVNNSSKNQSYSLSAKMPEGWTSSFTPAYDTKQIASVNVEAGKNQGLEVTFTPPTTVKAGTYPITCTASAAGETMTCDLTVIITGTYKMDFTTSSGLLNMEAYAGRETPVTLKITNSGSADLSDITLTSSASSNWSVRFDKAKIDSLAQGATQEIVAFIQPGNDAIAGDYAAAIMAGTQQTSSSINLRVAVKTSTAWGIIAVLIIIILVVGLVFVFRKFGRR